MTRTTAEQMRVTDTEVVLSGVMLRKEAAIETSAASRNVLEAAMTVWYFTRFQK